jgi:hypothetical protein
MKTVKGLFMLAYLWTSLVCCYSLVDFVPAPGVTHADHDEEHTGYAMSVRVHTLKNGVTVSQADRAIDGYLFEVTKRDDLIIYAGFYDSTVSRYVTVATWRTEAGAVASFDAAVAVPSGNYLNQITEETYYLGTLGHFAENLEIHSAVLLGNAAAVHIAALTRPSVYNQSSMLPVIINDAVSVWEPLTGSLDFTVLFPNLPTANTHFITALSWNTTADETAGTSVITADYTTRFPSAFTAVTYKGAIRNFYHAEPGTTPAAPKNAAFTASPISPFTALFMLGLVAIAALA